MSVYLPGQPIEEGFELDVDLNAYDILHHFSIEWPCLSFDMLHTFTNPNSKPDYPYSFSFVTGTQADSAKKNSIFIGKACNITKRKRKSLKEKHDDESEESDSDNDDDIELQDSTKNPTLKTVCIPHEGGVNRVRSYQNKLDQSQGLLAAWSDMGKVNIYDLAPSLKKLQGSMKESSKIKKKDSEKSLLSENHLLFSNAGHGIEGFALAWTPVETHAEPILMSGDCNGQIHLTKRTNNGFSVINQYKHAHNGSVEDIQWSPNEQFIFASCSTDGKIKIWDTRTQNTVHAAACSETDINVIAWNTAFPFLLASGHDDGILCSWDLRQFSGTAAASPIASFDWHKDSITSIEWNPNDATVLAASGADNQVTFWDFAVEEDNIPDMTDETVNADSSSIKDIPPQLLFIHQGQQHIKEVHWNAAIPGLLLTTAADGFNAFKPINI